MRSLIKNVQKLVVLGKDILKILDRKQQLRIAKLQIVILINAIVQPISMAVVLPFFAMVSDLEGMKSNEYYIWLVESYHISDLTIMWLLCAGTLAVLLLGLTTNFATEYVVLKLLAKTGIEIQQNLFSFYLNRPYAFFTGINSSTLMVRTRYGPNILVNTLLSSIIRLLSLSLVSLSILVLLLYKEFWSTLIFFFLVVSLYWVMTKILRHKLSEISRVTFQREVMLQQTLSQSFEAIKEMKVRCLEEEAEIAYDEANKKGYHAESNKKLYEAFPRVFMLSLVYVCLILFTGVHYQIYGNLKFILNTLILFGIAGIRLIPSIQDIYSSIIGILGVKEGYLQVKQDLIRAKFYISSREFSKFKKAEDIAIEKEICFENVRFRYMGAGKDVLRDLSFKIPVGSSVAFVGHSGSGKTTTADILLGLLAPHSGKIIIDGVEIDQKTKNFSKNFAYVPQAIFLKDDTVAKNIVFDNREIDKKQLELAIERAQLKELVDSLSDGYNTQIGERGIRLSGGQRQRIGIARALYMNTPVILFDEATSALDVITENEIVKSIDSLKNIKTLIVIAHRLSTVKKCDTIFLFENGTIKQMGTFDELVESNEVFRRMAELS